MKVLGRHDTLIAILGTGVLTAGYYLGVVSPGRAAASRIEAEISQIQLQMSGVPGILAERSHLQRRLDQQRDQLDRLEAALPTDSHVSSVLHQVASQARRSSLVIARLEPLPSVDLASYSTLPFHLSCRGKFTDITGFLKGLETQPRLVTFGSVEFTRVKEGPDSDGPAGTVQANLDFNVYSRNAKTTRLAENTASPRSSASDN